MLRGVSPLIWRRLLVPATTTIADLHAVLPAAFGWADEHLHRFVIHGREYGISYPGGVGFRDNPRRVSLAGFGLRAGERFVYDYDFIDGWRHDIRVEQLVPPEPGRSYPVCTGGRRAGPPEDAAARGRSWTCVSATACRSSPPAPPTCSGNSSTPPMMSMATTPSTGSPPVGASSPSCSGG